MAMIQHDLEQGSGEWLQFRYVHDGASEVAAVLGLSKNTTRNELLRMKKTGMGKEFSDYVQRMVLDKGHEVEAIARPVVEDMIGEELYPIVASNGSLMSASCDGLTMMEDIGWENKQYNQAYYEMVLAGDVPDEHMPQVQQCLLVTGAEKWFFTVSDGTIERTAGVWVYPEQAWFERIEAAWAQFHIDLESYELVQIVEPPKADVIKDLPAVTVHVVGELTTCNLNDVRPHFDRFLSEAITTMETDDDFAQAEAEAKLGRETAKRCKLTAKAVVDQMLSISEVTRTLEEYAAKFDALALKQEKAVKEQKEARKAAAKMQRDRAYAEHIEKINAEIAPVFLVLSQQDKPDFVAAMNYQRTLESLYNKLDTELARAKIAADSVAKNIKVNRNLLTEYAPYQFLFSDIQQIVYKPFDDLKLLIESRIDAHKKAESAKLEAERERIRLEEEARAKREIEQKMREEQAEKDRIVAEQVERDRLEREKQEMLDIAKADAYQNEAEPVKVEEPVRNAAGRTFEESKAMFGEVTLADVDMAMDKHFKDARSAKDPLNLSNAQLLKFIDTLIECGLKNTPCYFNTIQQMNMQSESGIDGYLIKASLCSSISEIADMLNNMPVEVKPTMKPILAEKQKIIKAQQAAV